MPAKRPDPVKLKNARIRELKRLGTLLLQHLGDLSEMRCPNCGGMRLRVTLTSHDAVFFGCDGTDDSDLSDDKWNCTYLMRVPFEPRHADLTVLEIEHGTDRNAAG